MLSEKKFKLEELTTRQRNQLKKLTIQALPGLQELYEDTGEIFKRRSTIVKLSYAKKIPKKITVVSICRRGDGHVERFGRIFENEGWQYYWCAPHELDDFCGKTVNGKSIAIVDLDHDYFETINQISYLEKLKHNFNFVIGFAFDGWSKNSRVQLVAIRDCLDLVWCPNLYYEHYSKNLPLGKLTPFPVPLGIHSDDQHTILPAVRSMEKIRFSGNIERQSFPRLLWFLEKGKKAGVEFDFSKYEERSTYHKYDSYLAYLGRLSQSKAVINFSTRNDMSRGFTGRSTETIALRQLLLQEYCPALNILFKPGEHFLQFKTMNDFDETCSIISDNQSLVYDIADNAYTFFQKNYSEKSLLLHLTAMLAL